MAGYLELTSSFDDREMTPERADWEMYMRDVPARRVEQVRMTVRPEHRECFDTHIENFRRWRPETCTKTGWPLLAYRGGLRTYMSDVDHIFPVRILRHSLRAVSRQ